MKDFSRAISKEALNTYPQETLPIPVEVVDADTPIERIKELCAELSKAHVLGFDTETKPSFTKGVVHKVALVQLSTESKAYLFRVFTFTKKAPLLPLRRIMESKRILKVGVASGDDARELKTDYGWDPSSILELRKLATAKGMTVGSLSKIYAILFDKRITKGQRLSDWEKPQLTEAQIQYGALDAYAGLMIFEALKDLYQESMNESAFSPMKAKRVKSKE